MSLTTDSHGRKLLLQRIIGRGGFGEVFEASIQTSAGLSRRVAVKILREDLDDGDDALLRLTDEAQLLSYLRHPVVVMVEDLIQIGGRTALISEFVDGADLSSAIPMPARAALEMISKVAEALAAAWGQRGPSGTPLRIVHRDLKPANIRLGPHGVVKLLDFGIARSDSMARAAKTSTGMMVGSMGYMAPERWAGAPDAHHGDVYALGCVLFETLTGHALFKGLETPAQVGIALSAERHAQFLEERLATLPAPCRRAHRLLRDMLQHQPSERPTAAQVASRALSLSGRMPGESLLEWSSCLDELPSDPASEQVDSSWIEGPAGFRRSDSTAVTGETTLAHDRPADARGMPGPPASGSSPSGARWRRLGLAAVVLVLVGGVIVVGGGTVAAGALYSGWSGSDSDVPDEPTTRAGDADRLRSATGDQEGAPHPSLVGASHDEAPEGDAGGADLVHAGATDEPPSTPVGASLASEEPPGPPVGTSSAPELTAPSASSTTASARAPRDVSAAPATHREPPPADPAAAGGATGVPASAVSPPQAPESPATGYLRIEGHQAVRVRGAQGLREPGRLPPGRYTVQASFDPGSWTDLQTLEVRAGQEIVLRCNTRFRSCR